MRHLLVFSIASPKLAPISRRVQKPITRLFLLLGMILCISFNHARAYDEVKAQAVDELMQIMETRKLSGLMAQALTSQLAQMLQKQAGKPLDKAVLDIIYAEAQVIMYEKYILNNKLREIFYKLYDEYYTRDQLLEVLAFYKSPAGQRTLEIGNQLSQRSMTMAQEFGATFSEEAQKRIMRKLKEVSEQIEASEQKRKAQEGTP